jgi:transposase-like protein
MEISNSFRSIPKFKDILNLITCEDAAEAYLFEKSMIFPKPMCYECGGLTKRKRNLWICIKKSCAKSVSIFKGSFFEKTSLKCCEILHFCYLWLAGVRTNSIIAITGHSPNTIVDYIKYINQLVCENLDQKKCCIGGDQIIVEIDECKIAKRKHNRGHPVEGAWIVGGVERTPERHLFVEVVEDRTADTLREVISRYVRPGSIVHTDCWRGYASLNELGIDHKTVNHKKHFKDPISGVHTNTIEGTWAGIKGSIAVRNRNKGTVDKHLLAFIWRRENANRLWNALIQAFAETIYI